MGVIDSKFLYFDKDASFNGKKSQIDASNAYSITFLPESNAIYANKHMFKAEDPDNKVYTLNVDSTNTQYPSAKCVYDAFGNVIINQTDTNVEINPNVMNLWGEVSSLTITLGTIVDINRTNEYMLQFNSPSSAATTFSYPNTITWGESNATTESGSTFIPEILPGKTYQISIINNKGLICAF